MADGAQHAPDLCVEPPGYPEQPVRCGAGGHPVPGGQDGRHVAHPDVGTGADIPIAGRGGVFHGQPVRGGDVADVDDGPAQAGYARNVAGEQAADGLQRGAGRGVLDRAQHQSGVDHHQLGPWLRTHEVPGRPFGQRLALLVRVVTVDVCPVGLGERLRTGVVRSDGRDRGGEHHPPHGAAHGTGPEHPQRTLDGRPDQFILVGRVLERKRRGHMQHVLAPGHRLGPAFVGLQVSRHQLGQALQVGRPGRIPDRPPHLVAVAGQLGDAVPGDEPRCPGDKNVRHDGPPI